MAYFDLPLSSGLIPTTSGNIATFVPQARPNLRDFPRPVAPQHAEPQPFPAIDARELEVRIDHAQAALWCYMRPNGPPSFTPTMLRDIIDLRDTISTYMGAQRPGEGLRYFIGASRLPGIFNLGGDLGYFVQSIRTGDTQRLRAYAHDCCEVAWHMSSGFETPVVTIALVQGDALGGGFEGALSFQILVAEKSARMGLPEVLFNLFPGMGAFSLLTRKIGVARAERMIRSGKVYTAAELHDLGVVDILAEDGQGEAEIRKFIAGGAARHRLNHALSRVARRVAPVTLEELIDVTDIWVETAMKLDDSDLRRMEKLALAQRRRLATA